MDRRQVLKTLALGAASIPLVQATALADVSPSMPVVKVKDPAAAAPVAPAAPTGPFTLPPLGYAFDALEPFLDAQTMQIHHDKHHAAYVTNLNKAVTGRPEVEGWPVERLMHDLAVVPEDIRTAVRNHGGGHANHSLLWKSLKKDGAKAPKGELSEAINAAFGSFAAFGEKFTAASMSVFGSGWAWLSKDAQGIVRIETTPNQESPLTAGRVPIVGIDVWEHAYYLKFQNRRAEYVTAFASVIDWDAAAARYKDTH